MLIIPVLIYYRVYKMMAPVNYTLKNNMQQSKQIPTKPGPYLVTGYGKTYLQILTIIS